MPDDLKQSFWNYLDIFSMWMINSNEQKISQKKAYLSTISKKFGSEN